MNKYAKLNLAEKLLKEAYSSNSIIGSLTDVMNNIGASQINETYSHDIWNITLLEDQRQWKNDHDIKGSYLIFEIHSDEEKFYIKLIKKDTELNIKLVSKHYKIVETFNEIHDDLDDITYRSNDILNKTIEYCKYLDIHLDNIETAFKHVVKKVFISDILSSPNDVYEHLEMNVSRHDISKFSKEEFASYREKFYPSVYDDNPYMDFKSAWEHHYTNNNHHIEYINEYYKTAPIIKSYIQAAILHMVIDWYAMSLYFGDKGPKWYYEEKSKIKLKNKDYEEFLYKVFDLI